MSEIATAPKWKPSPEHLAALAAGRERKQAEKRAAQSTALHTNLAPSMPVHTEMPLWAVKSPIRRFTADMIDDWFLGRLEKIWPGHSPATWRGRFLGFGMSNEYLSVCNGRAVHLAMVIRQPMTGRPIVWEVLAWSRDAEDNWLPKEKGQAIFALYHHCRQWSDSMRAERTIFGVCSDLRGDVIAARLIEHYGAQGAPLVDISGRVK